MIIVFNDLPNLTSLLIGSALSVRLGIRRINTTENRKSLSLPQIGKADTKELSKQLGLYFIWPLHAR